MPFDYKNYILSHFKYCKDGTLKRDDRKNSVGSYDKYGYLVVKVKGKQFKSHRIVWLLCTGDFPKSELDHINRNKTDNRIENLREATRLEQNRNKEAKINKDTGVRGVYIDRTKGLKKKFAFKANKKTYRFYTLKDAVKERGTIYGECS